MTSRWMKPSHSSGWSWMRSGMIHSKGLNTHCFDSFCCYWCFFVFHSSNSPCILDIYPHYICTFIFFLIEPGLTKCWCNVWWCRCASPGINDTDDFLLFVRQISRRINTSLKSLLNSKYSSSLSDSSRLFPRGRPRRFVVCIIFLLKK